MVNLVGHGMCITLRVRIVDLRYRIFILEGLATLLIGVASFWMVHDFPDEAKFLTDDERRRVLRKLASDKQGSSKHEDFQMSYLWQVLKDWKTYTGMLVLSSYCGVLS